MPTPAVTILKRYLLPAMGGFHDFVGQHTQPASCFGIAIFVILQSSICKGPPSMKQFTKMLHRACQGSSLLGTDLGQRAALPGAKTTSVSLTSLLGAQYASSTVLLQMWLW